MNTNAQTSVNLILGTYEHDLLKPFWLPNRHHAELGYLYLKSVQQSTPTRYAAVFLHVPNSYYDHLNEFAKDHPGVSLAKALLIAPVIDRLASASYSLLDSFEDMKAWPPSVQNPFSRLLLYTKFNSLGRVRAEEGQTGSEFAESRFQQFLIDLSGSLGLQQTYKTLVAQLVHVRQTSSKRNEIDFAEDAIAESFKSFISQINSEQIIAVDSAYRVFAERTYPTANDTFLASHTKLAANLYNLFLSNLPIGHQLNGDGLEQWLQDRTQLNFWLGRKPRTSINLLNDILPLLSTYVCQIRLTGLDAYFTNAVRLDDLQGAKLLADRIRYMLKRQMCTAFGLGDQAEEAAFDGTKLADLLCISESRFTLTYLMPASLVQQQEELPGLLYECYRKALLDVVTKEYPPARQVEQRSPQPLLDFLRSDIRRSLARDVNGKQVDLQPNATELLEGLELFLPTFAFAYVDGTPDTSTQLEEGYGKKVVIAYQQVQEDPGLMPATIQTQLQQMAAVEETIALCTSTGAARAWQALSNHAYGRPGHTEVQQLLEYFHDFRAGAVEEPEEISQVVTAMRGLAHGVAQEEALKQMVKCEVADPCLSDKSDQLTLKYQDAADPKLPLPPLLQRTGEIPQNGKLVDLNAAYIRTRSDEDAADPLIRFPSVTYAADHHSNVALITLRPTPQVYEKQCFPAGFVYDVNGDGTHFDLRDENGKALNTELQAYQDLYTYYFNLSGKGKETALRAELMTIPAHLARVLQRQETITRFFGALHLRLQAAGVRSLKLEDRFPVGRYLVPANLLTRALEVLDRSICLDLLAVNGVDLGLTDDKAMKNITTYNVLEGDADGIIDKKGQVDKLDKLHHFLCSYVPPILTGTTMLFKHKQALYLMLRAEERLRQQVAAAPVMAMGLIDMRGTLVDRGEIHGSYTFAGWHEVAKTVQQVDRQSLDALARDADWAQRWSPHSTQVDEAVQALVEARWQNRTKAADARKRKMPKDLADKAKKALRDAAYYLVRAQHGGEG